MKAEKVQCGCGVIALFFYRIPLHNVGSYPYYVSITEELSLGRFEDSHTLLI